MEQNGRESGHVGKNKCIERTDKIDDDTSKKVSEAKGMEIGTISYIK